jgi:hypothetical protein
MTKPTPEELDAILADAPKCPIKLRHVNRGDYDTVTSIGVGGCVLNRFECKQWTFMLNNYALPQDLYDYCKKRERETFSWNYSD